MTVTTEPEFYDAAMTGDDEPAMLPLEDSPWREVYLRAAEWIAPEDPVVELGCGTGRFAEQLRRRGHGTYAGIDFSPAAIAEADEYVSDFNSDTDWERTFTVADLRGWMPDYPRDGATVYVCLETLEHLTDDLDLVRRIPVGHELIFSVPSYESEAHLRNFQDVGDAWERYGGLLAFSAWALVPLGVRSFIHLYRSRRRGDAW